MAEQVAARMTKGKKSKAPDISKTDSKMTASTESKINPDTSGTPGPTTTKTRNRQTALLVGIFALVVLFAVGLNFVRRNIENSKGLAAPTPSDRYFFPYLEPVQINRIDITNIATGRKLKFVRIPGGWDITDEKGTKVDINVAVIPRMLQNLAILSYNRVMNSSEVDVTTFGLANGGQFQVSFEAAGTSHTLHVGAINTSATSSYIQLDGDSSMKSTNTNSNTGTSAPQNAVFLAPVQQISYVVGLVVDNPEATSTP